jgi:hypothetical protein
MPAPVTVPADDDGGMLMNVPISAFDRADGEAPRWPTIIKWGRAGHVPRGGTSHAPGLASWASRA